MITLTIESYWIPSQKKKNVKSLNLWNIFYTQHTFWSCLIRCANVKWIRLVLLKMQSGHDSVYRWTDGQGETSIPPFQHHWSGGYNEQINRTDVDPEETFNKIVKNLNFDTSGGPNIWASGAYLLHTYKSSSNELINQVLSESSGNSKKRRQKSIHWLILALFGH